MGTSVGIFIRPQLEERDFEDFVRSYDGGEWHNSPGLPGTVYQDGPCIWVGLSKEISYMLEDGIDSRIISIIGGQPHSFISVEISREDGSLKLATEFCAKFCTHWPAAVNDLNVNPRIYSRDDLLRLLAEGKTVCS